MNRESLYRAIGDISSRYIADVPGKIHSDAGSSHNSVNGRVIEMSVVKRKKIRFVLVAAVILLVGAVAVAAAFGLLGKDDKVNKITEKKIENYFTDNGSYKLDISNNIENLTAGKDRVFFTSYLSEGDPINKLAVFDKKTKRTKEIDISGLDLQYFNKIYLSENYCFVFYTDKNGDNRICRFDKDFSPESAVNIKTEGYVYRISETDRNTILVTENILHGNESEMKVLEYSADPLELVNTVSFDEVISGGAYGEIKDIFHGNDFYYIVCQKKNGQIDLIKKDAGGNNLYLAENICVDMEGEYSGCLMSYEGDIVVFTSFINSEGTLCHSFDQISCETGEIIFRYDEIFDVNGFVPCYIQATESIDPEYDFEYINTSMGTICGYSFDSEEKTEIWKLKDPSSQTLSAAVSSEESIVYGFSDSMECEKGQTLFVTDLNGNVIRKVLLSQDKLYENNMVNVCMSADKSDELYLIENNDVQISGTLNMETENILFHYSKDGELINSLRLTVPDSGKKQERKIRCYSDLTVREDGSILCADSGIIDIFSSDGGFIDEIEYPGGECCLVSLKNEDYLIAESSEYHGKSGKIYRINSENRLETVSDFSYKFPDNKETQFFDGDDEYDFYISQSDGIYGYKISEGRMDEIINWIDSDLDSSPSTVALLDSNRIICGINDYLLNFAPDSFDYRISAVMFERASDEALRQVQNRKTVTIACDSVSQALMKKISEFNRTHQDCRITVREYSKFYSDDSSGISKFNMDLITGIIPDIVLSDGTIDMARYTKLGMFADMNGFIDGDSEINRSDYYDSVFRAFSKSRKLYEMPVFFNINEIIGRESDVGNIDSVTFDDLRRMSEGKKLFSGTSEELVSELIKNNITEFVDFENCTCNFNNKDFTGLLEIIRNDSGEESSYANGIQNDFLNRNCLFSCYKFTREFLDGQKNNTDDPLVYISYPSSKSEGTLVSAAFSAAIAEKSDNKEEAWEFIKMLLSDEFQNSIMHYSTFMNGIPVKRSAAEKFIENDPERINVLIESASRTVLNDTSINKIIDEQTERFLNNGQSAEETARNIDRKVSLYLKEIQ